MWQHNKAKLLLSTDTLSGYGLDLIFDIAKNINFEWIDLALRKSFDTYNINYIKKLITKYNMPVEVVQTSSEVNLVELNHAVDLARAIDAKVIAINAPAFFNFRSFRFLSANLTQYMKQNPQLKFAIINPSKASLFYLPIPKFRFSNIVEIIKKQKAHLALDIVHLDNENFENSLMRKLSNFIPYLSIIYLADKPRFYETHVPLGEWVLKVATFLKKLKQNEYYNYFSIKLDLNKSQLADSEKIEMILKKCRLYYKEYFEDLILE